MRTTDTDRIAVRGLEPRDLAALDALTEQRRAQLEPQGGAVSRNSVLLALLRGALAAAGAYELPGVEGAT